MARDPMDPGTGNLPGIEALPRVRLGFVVSSPTDPDLQLQRAAMARAGVADVIEAGRDDAGQAFDAGIRGLRPGDTLVVWRMDRLRMGTAKLVQLIAMLQRRDIGFQALVERIDTQATEGWAFGEVMHVLSLAEQVRAKEWASAAARDRADPARGRTSGRKRSLSDVQLKKAIRLLGQRDLKVADIAARVGVSRSTLYRNIKQRGKLS